MLSRVRHVVGHEPRKRSYAAVPGPAGLVGLAVVTRVAQNPAHLGRSRHLVLRGRILAIHGEQLREHQNAHERHSDLNLHRASPDLV